MRKIQRRKSDFMVKRQRGSAGYPQFKGIGVQDVPVDVCSARTGVERRPSPTSKNAPGIYRSTACQFVKREKKGLSL
jgi:replication initiator protein A (repA) N-terminus